MTRRRIPKEKIEEAMVYWLLGDSARIAAKRANISKNVLLEYLRKRPDAEILIERYHVIAERLKKEGLDILSYSVIIRTSNFLREMGLNEKYILHFMTEFAQFAYDFHCDPNKLTRIMIRIIQFMEVGGFKTPTQFAEYMKRQENNLERIREHAAEMEAQAQDAFDRCIRINLNRKYLERDPTIGFKMDDLERENKELKVKLAEYKRREALPKYFITRGMGEGEAKRLSRKLGRRVRPDEIYKKAQDVVLHPSQYSYLFLKCDPLPSICPDSTVDSQGDGDDTNEIDPSYNSDNLSLDRTMGTEPDADTDKKDTEFEEKIGD